MQTCKNGHSFDPQVTTYCPRCPIEGLDLDDLRVTSSKVPPKESAFARAGPRPGDPPPAASRPAQRKTIAFYPGLNEPSRERVSGRVDPVVGWLVAHKGPALGRDFRIRYGNNSIGRAPNQAISIHEDMHIHNEEHAFIVFDSRRNQFRLRPGVQRNLVHLHDGDPENAELVSETVPLLPYQTIMIGESELIFVPLCGESFSWDFRKGDKEPAS